MKKIVFGLVAIIIVSFSANAQSDAFKGGPEGFNSLSVKGFLLSADHGCYTILVNVYQNVNGTLFIVASSTVCVGECGKFSPKNDNSTCVDFELNGDLFYNSKYNQNYCIEELFKDETTYKNYLIAKNSVLEALKN
jgi:hypothetical protein